MSIAALLTAARAVAPSPDTLSLHERTYRDYMLPLDPAAIDALLAICRPSSSRLSPPPRSNETWDQLPHTKLSKKQLREKKAQTSGKDWFDMPKQEITPELRREVQALRLKNQLDPKRFMRGEANRDSAKLPEFFQMGYVIDGDKRATTSTEGRNAKKRSFIEDLVEDQDAKAYAKKKFNEVQAKAASGGRGHYLVAKWINNGTALHVVDVKPFVRLLAQTGISKDWKTFTDLLRAHSFRSLDKSKHTWAHIHFLQGRTDLLPLITSNAPSSSRPARTKRSKAAEEIAIDSISSDLSVPASSEEKIAFFYDKPDSPTLIPVITIDDSLVVPKLEINSPPPAVSFDENMVPMHVVTALQRQIDILRSDLDVALAGNRETNAMARVLSVKSVQDRTRENSIVQLLGDLYHWADVHHQDDLPFGIPPLLATPSQDQFRNFIPSYPQWPQSQLTSHLPSPTYSPPRHHSAPAPTSVSSHTFLRQLSLDTPTKAQKQEMLEYSPPAVPAPRPRYSFAFQQESPTSFSSAYKN